VLISSAFAAAPAAAPAPGFDIMGMLPLVLILVVFYFMLIRPQAKRAKELRAMLDALQKGDEVVTQGGTLGKVVKVSDNYVSLEIADNVITHVQKSAVQTLLPKGTIKGIKD
jgi:preprotein translocase subunit YajC